jgi:hypothetical protein
MQNSETDCLYQDFVFVTTKILNWQYWSLSWAGQIRMRSATVKHKQPKIVVFRLPIHSFILLRLSLMALKSGIQTSGLDVPPGRRLLLHLRQSRISPLQALNGDAISDITISSFHVVYGCYVSYTFPCLVSDRVLYVFTASCLINKPRDNFTVTFVFPDWLSIFKYSLELLARTC